MSDPIGASTALSPGLSPGWLDAAYARAADFGFGEDLAGLGESRWQVLCQAVELTVAGQEAFPANWRVDLARQAGRVPAVDRRRDAADAEPAGTGEVFAGDDDA